MPRARRSKATPPPAEVEAEQQTGEQQNEMDVDGTHVLEFSEPLSWTPGRPIAVAELLRRLKALCTELQDMDQDNVNRKSVLPRAQELAHPRLLKHTDKGVQAWSLLCIVEVIRLFAPDAPYKQSQLKDVFEIFVSTVILAMAHPSDPYTGQYLKILDSLATVKSVLLITDVPGSDRLILSLFTNCFDVMAGNVKGSGEELSKNVEFNMTTLLIALIDECADLPPGVIDIMLAQFLRANPSVFQGKKKGDMQQTQTLTQLSPAYNMAKSVCNSCEDKMIRHIGQYFNSVLIDASETMTTVRKQNNKKRGRFERDDDSDADLLTPPPETDLEEAAKAHRLLRELWRSCPEVIRNVIPQIEAEVGAENLPLRVMAVQTVGDMISGIGAAGPPPSTSLDPAAYPSQSLTADAPRILHPFLLSAAAPHAFSSVYPTTYQAFVDRHRDKAPQVRSAWATEAGRIILTAGGGKGLDLDQQSTLQRCLADMLMDTDEKVRLAAINVIAEFDFHSVLQKLCEFGGVTSKGSLLFNLADRIKDLKTPVRIAAMELLGRLWGVGAGAIAEGNERIRELLGPIPSKIFDAMYVNDKSINALVRRVMWESLLPIGFPPIKSKAATNGDSQRIIDSQSAEERVPDPDEIRVERMLILMRDLDDRTKTVFFSLQVNAVQNAKYLNFALEKKETDDDETALQKMLGALASHSSEPSLALNHLSTFIKQHDRRNFSLVRFCTSAESDYKKVVNAMKELMKRMEQAPTNISSCLETILPCVRSASFLVYNRSHVPAIMAFSRSDEKGLASAAHEVMRRISSNAPDVFKVHVKDLCESLKKQALSKDTSDDPLAVDELKACAEFARQFPAELRQKRDFYQAMVAIAVNGSPPRAAKHAVTVIVSAAEKKEMYIRDILRSCIKDFKLGEDGSLAKLAALGQLNLLAGDHVHEQADAITEIATNVLTCPPTDGIDDDLDAKLLALKVVVNRLRNCAPKTTAEELTAEGRELSVKVFKLLNTIIEKEGELSQTDDKTPDDHCAQLRLSAAKLTLKLCCNKALDRRFAASDFIRLIRIVQDSLPMVRAGFNDALRKYLSQDKLPRRFYSLAFIYAFEPVQSTKERTVTFLKARCAKLAAAADPTMQSVFAHLLSLLAHHQDFSPAAEDLVDCVEYIVFYLKIVATEKNLPEIYSIAQRVKTVQDDIDPEMSENLYVLSDLSEAIIRQFADMQSWSLQLLPGKAKLPMGLFAKLPNHAVAQEISEKRYLPDELVENLDDLVKTRMRQKKRKSTGNEDRASKRAKASLGAAVKSEKAAKISKNVKSTKPKQNTQKKATDPALSSVRRKSTRTSNAKSYAEPDDTEDEELEQWQQESEEEEAEQEDDQDEDDEEEDKHEQEPNSMDVDGGAEVVTSSTPPTSDQTPTSAPPSRKRKAPEEVTSAMKKPAPQKKASKAPARKLPTRGGRTRAAKKERDEMSLSDSNGDPSNPQNDVEA